MLLSFEQIRDAAWKALRLLLGDSYNWSVVATFADAVIISNGPTKLERYPLTIDAAGTLTLGTPQAVEVAYQALTEGRGVGLLGPIMLAEASKDGAAAVPDNGREWACVVIQEGLTGNKTLYTANALRGAVSLFEGAQVFWNHEPNRDFRDPRDIAGFLKGPQYALLEGKNPTGAILARFVATDQKARTQLLEAFDAGNPNLTGLSIHAGGKGEIVRLREGSVYRVDEILKVKSVDIVAKPAAGGRFLRLVAGMPAEPVTDKELEVMDKKLKALKARPDLYKRLSATPTEGEVDGLLLEALDSAPEPEPAQAPTPASPATPAAPVELTESDRSALLDLRVERMLKGRTLPTQLLEATRETMVALFQAGSPEATVKAFLEAQVKGSASLVESRIGIRGSGAGRVDVSSDEADKVQKAWDGFFEGKDVDGVGRFRSLREGYIETTGDVHVTGQVRDAKLISRFANLFEGMQSGTLANVLASSLNRQLVSDYNAQGGAYSDDGRGWLYRVVPANDFRTRERTRVGGYGNLSTVAEGNPYPAMSSPTDEKATYAISKKGGTETITFEMIRNDDVGVVQDIPRRMAMAARRTFYEFVHDLYVTNPTIYDAVALFHASHGGNLGASALSASSFAAARLVMQKQTEKNSLKRLGLILRHLMVPMDLAEAAYNLFVRDTNLDAKFVQTGNVAPTIHVITHVSDANDWFACAGIDQAPQIEVGFLDGREDPELFVADLPNSGSLFAADKIDYKIRHIYNGAVLDYRPFFGAYGI